MMLGRFLALSLIARFSHGEKDMGQVCRNTDKSDGGCALDGTGCDGEQVEFAYYEMNVSSWDAAAKKNHLIGTMSSFAIEGDMDTWQMYLHGPLLRPSERATPTSIPPLYTHATWTNKLYRFDGFAEPVAGKSLTARQKLVGWADAPSTSWPIEDSKTSKLKGLMVAEGQPFILSNFAGNHSGKIEEIGTGGVSVIHADADHKKCDKIFPKNMMSKMLGEVVNTVDCHKTLGVCFFTVWKFYDDSSKIIQPIINLLAPDCLHYCIAEDLDTYPSCSKIGIVVDENGEKVCHKDGVGAVHGMTIGNDNQADATQFDIFLVFTGGMKFDTGESSMKKLNVQVTGLGSESRDLKVLKSAPFAEQLFKDLPPAGLDVGGDHAWVDETRKLIWVSTFRTGGAGVHMLDYTTGALKYSVTGVSHYLPGQYLYSAGIHGIGTIGKKGSFIAVATSACYNIAVCAPIPWSAPFPKRMWAKGVQFIIDIGNFTVETSRTEYV